MVKVGPHNPPYEIAKACVQYKRPLDVGWWRLAGLPDEVKPKKPLCFSITCALCSKGANEPVIELRRSAFGAAMKQYYTGQCESCLAIYWHSEDENEKE